MNKKIIIFLFIILLPIAYLFNIERIISNKILSFTNAVSSTIINSMLFIEININKYINQTKYIETLKYQNDNNYKFQILNKINQNKLHELENILNLDLNNSIDFKLVKVLSYQDINDNSKVVIELLNNNSEKILPLITSDGYSAGIIIKKEHQYIGYLNNNIKSNYAVYIGDTNAPGITSGMSPEGKLIIKHIPLWKKITINDDIITSGMDNIFPYGITVGKVIHIKQNELTQTIEATPHNNSLTQRFFYTIN